MLTINMGVGKTGTSALQSYFKCSGLRTSHNMNCGIYRCSKALTYFLDNNSSIKNEHLFRNYTGNYEAYTEMNDMSHCDFPQVDRIDEIVQILRNTCFILTYRTTASWLHSLKNFRAGPYRQTSFMEITTACKLRNRKPRNEKELEVWYSTHVERSMKILERTKCPVFINISNEKDSSNFGNKLHTILPDTANYCSIKKNHTFVKSHSSSSKP